MVAKNTIAIEADRSGDQYLTFLLGEQHYGIPVGSVREIIGYQAFTEVPNLPAYMKGIINLRGSIIPLMDLRLRFNETFKPYHERTCVIITELSGILIGLLVDFLDDVVVMNAQDYCDHPIVGLDEGNAYIEKVGKHNDQLVFLLSTEKLIESQLSDELCAQSDFS